MKMNKLIWIVCVIVVTFVVVDATYRQCQTFCPDGPPPPPCGSQGQKGEKGEITKSCNCSALEEVQQQLSRTEEKLAETEQKLSNLEDKPRDCYDIIYYNPNATSGVYTIFPANYRPGGIEVSCDMDTDGGGWIVFQNRKDGSVDFYRNWKNYLIGFGNLTQEFWLGLEYIHELSKYGTYDLRVDMSDFEKNEAYAVYSSFSIGEGPGYELKFGEYFGDAGDSLDYHRNQNFSTYDNDQDSKSDDDGGSNCSINHRGAWWFNSCRRSNLNGEYLGADNEVQFRGMIWEEFKGDYYSLKTTQMKMRPHYVNYA